MSNKSLLKVFTVILAFVLLAAVPGSASEWDACGCDYMSPCTPSLAFEAGMIGLYRDSPKAGLLARNLSNSVEVLSADQFEFNMEGGFETSLCYTMACGLGLEGRYFGINDWDGRTVVPFSSGILDFGSLVQIASQPTNVVSTFSSELQNAEFNLRSQSDLVPWVTWIAGYRYLKLEESLQHQIVDPVGLGSDTIYYERTSNPLHGFQIGTQADIWSGDQFGLDVVAKAGIFGNSASRIANVYVSPGMAPAPFTADVMHAAFVGEVGVGASWYFLKGVSLRARYSLLWVDGVALTSRQSTFLSAGTMHVDGGTFYQGGFLGLQIEI